MMPDTGRAIKNVFYTKNLKNLKSYGGVCECVSHGPNFSNFTVNCL